MRLFEDPGRQRIRHGEAGKGKRDVCFGTCQSFCFESRFHWPWSL